MTFKFGNAYENVNVYNTVTSIEDDLDFASIVIPYSSRKARYEPFTLVEIDLDTVTEYWYVNSDTTKPVDLGERTKHRHEITLIELTKILERYPMPNRAFTAGGTLLEVVQNLIDTVPFDDTFNYTNTRIIDSIDTDLSIALNIQAPEIFLSERTLLEAFIEVFKLIKAFPRLTYDGANWVLSADFYNDLADLVDKELDIANRVEVQDASKYATSTVISGSNQLDLDVTIIEPSPSEWLGLRGDGGILDIEQSFIQVQQPIELISNVMIEFNYGYISGGPYTETITADITDYVVEAEEKKALDTVASDYVLGNGIPAVYQDIYRDNTIQYLKGSTKIEGLYEQYQPDLIGSTSAALYLLMRTVVYRDNAENPEGIYPEFEPDLIKFRVTYIPKINARQELERFDLSEFSTNSTLIQGQSDKFLSSKKMLSNAYSRLNRTGNTEIKTSVHNVNLSDIKPVGTYTDDGYILTEVERLKHMEHYDINYKWTKDFQKVSEFLSLDSEPRLFEIGQSLVRNEIFKQYIVLDTVPATNNSYMNDAAFSTYINTLRPTPLTAYDKPITSAVVQSADMAVTGVLRAVTAYGGANTLNMFWAFDSPLSAGIQVVETDTHKQNKVVKYTNDDYELEDFNCYYVNDTTIVSEDLPVVATPTSYLVDARGFKTKKDKSDIQALTYQIITTAQQGLKAFVGKKFIENNNLIKEIDTYETLKVYFSDQVYDANDLEFVKGFESAGATYTYYATNKYIELDAVTTYRSWAIGNDDRELYFAVTQSLDELGEIIDTRRIYFNMRNDRQDSTYSPPVLPPINLTATAGSDAIYFDWDDANTSDSFNVQIYEGTSLIDSVSTTQTYYNFTGLDPDTEYTLKVRAKVGANFSVFSSITESTTTGAPAMPSWLNTTVISTTQIDLEWEDVTGEQYYQINWSTNEIDWYGSETKGAGQTTHSYTSLSAGTGYYFRVRAGDEILGDSAWYVTPEQTFTLSETPQAATPNINSLDTTTYDDRVTFTLTNNDTSTATLYADVQAGSYDPSPDINMGSYAGGATTETKTISGLGTNTTWYISAQAKVSGENDSNTRTGGSFTLTAKSSPTAPSNFTGSPSGTNVTLNWNDNSHNEDGFEIQFIRQGGDFSSPYYTFSSTYNTESKIVTMATGFIYEGRIRATNSVGDSSWAGTFIDMT